MMNFSPKQIKQRILDLKVNMKNLHSFVPSRNYYLITFILNYISTLYYGMERMMELEAIAIKDKKHRIFSILKLNGYIYHMRAYTDLEEILLEQVSRIRHELTFNKKRLN